LSIYSYPQSKIIDEVTFKKTANGAIRAYLHAHTGMDTPSVQTILQKLKDKTFECIPFTLDGKPVVEVRGFKNEAHFLKKMAGEGWVEGDPVIKASPEDNISWMDIIRKRSIQLSGLVMMAADTGFIMYGAKEKHWENALAGLSYLGGSTTLFAYGRNDQSELQIREMAQMILQKARERGFAIPDESAASSVGRMRKESALRQVDNFFRAHPAEIGNMMYFAAGTLVAKAALQHHAFATPRPGMTRQQIGEMRKEGWKDTGLGAMTMSSGLLATMVKEKAIDPDQPKSTGLGGIVDWIREKPLRLASYGYMGAPCSMHGVPMMRIGRPNVPARMYYFPLRSGLRRTHDLSPCHGGPCLSVGRYLESCYYPSPRKGMAKASSAIIPLIAASSRLPLT